MNNSFRMTKHAIERTSQRGIKIKDVPLILLYGTEASHGRVWVTKKNAYQAGKIDEKLQRKLCDLIGKCIVADGNTIITAYHSSPAQQRRMLRN
jgi:hypothetical protein